jgi:hypothetical protein
MSKGISTLVESGYKAKNFAAPRFDMNDWYQGMPLGTPFHHATYGGFSRCLRPRPNLSG